ncbi:MAG: UDP-N-acetylmuramoyl-L-alanine--D-glutamate ligase [Candidatus Eremiobacterota bacterium]
MKPVPEDLSDRSVAIMGAGKSGLALMRELTARGARVFLSDQRTAGELGELPLEGVELELGGHTDRIYRGRDLVVISPGISVHHPILVEARQHGVPVAGEVEMAYRFCRAPFVAVTGTNGKSTTATLIHRMLEPRSILAGNIGSPLVAEVTPLGPDRLVVAEISSFQLETTHRFRPQVAVLTNITADHLDRHPTFQEYVAAKARLFSFQTPEDLALFSSDDPESRRLGQQLRQGRLPAWLADFPAPESPPRPRVLEFSTRGPVARGAWLEHGLVRFRMGGEAERLFPWGFPGLPGPHNLSNALAAVAVARALDVPAERIKSVLASHQTLHHRLELVGEVGGVRFVDDSKATNPSSVEAALDTFEGPIVLIAGGKDKGTDFTSLGVKVRQRARHLVLIGEAAERLEAAARKAGMESVYPCGFDFERAVDTAAGLAEPGGVVLLSPACASFDMFKNAEDRGEQFRALVERRMR